jgi:hypothetical protein
MSGRNAAERSACDPENPVLRFKLRETATGNRSGSGRRSRVPLIWEQAALASAGSAEWTPAEVKAMRAGSSRRSWGIGAGLVVAVLIAPLEVALAQAPAQPEPPSARAGPAIPDGITVTPSRPLASPPGYGEADGAGRERDADAERQPPGGCRYREQKLELIV